MTPYADTNFLVRLYLDLPDSDAVSHLISGAAKSIILPITTLHRVELCNAIQLYVFQQHSRDRHVTSEQAAIAWASFREEIRAPGRLFLTTIASDDLEREAEELSLRHTARHGFRTYDVLHVASALLLKCDTFWSFDEKALHLAALEGLKTRKVPG